MPDPLDTHCKMVIKAITDGRVVPFLGAGINVCARPAGTDSEPDRALPESHPLRDGAPRRAAGPVKPTTPALASCP